MPLAPRCTRVSQEKPSISVSQAPQDFASATRANSLCARNAATASSSAVAVSGGAHQNQFESVALIPPSKLDSAAQIGTCRGRHSWSGLRGFARLGVVVAFAVDGGHLGAHGA